MKLSQYTLSLLDDIEKRIIPENEEDFVEQWKKFWNGEIEDTLFVPKRKIVSQSGIEVKDININDAIEDYELMLDMQLAGISAALGKTKEAIGTRANYGTGIMTSLFGAELFVMDRKHNTLPTTRSFNDTEVIRKIVDDGMPALDSALGKKVFEYGEFYLEVIKNYPKIAKYVFMYHPDTQGPLDVAELLWGGEMFYALYDEPELVHGLMELITNTYIAFLEKWFRMFLNREDINVHWNFWMRGAICLRNDSAVNLAPSQYEEFVLEYDKRVLEHFGGGMMHYCGKGDQFVGLVTENTIVSGVHLSQPHLNDMNKVFGATVDKGVRLLALAPETAQEYAKKPHALKGMIYCG